ncbi:MFS transporter [Nocardioides alcanivorans]|uniref:MFS transporter n=1 Tax=Nocardioides alcanivorans TaxID=2897352 RepID=UPI001F332224|nr:MFS transporter [Nocardioides alcanivorans]
MTSNTPAAATDEVETNHAWALVLICVAQLMVVLDGTIANIALPYIGADLDIGQANLQWIVTGYALAFGGLLLLGGRLGDLYGRRLIFMIGVTVFAVASLLGGLATNEGLLLASRGLQGVGASLAAPAALALITTTFPAGPARSRAFAVYAAMSGIGAAVGLLLGGWLTGSGFDAFGVHVDGWRLTFLINVPIGLAAAAAAPRVLRESERHTGWLDVPGAITGTGGLLAIVFGLSRAGEPAHGWGDTWTISSLVAGALLLLVFVLVERNQEHPLLPFRVLANRTRAASFAAMFLMPAAMFAMFFFLSLFVQNVMGYSPLKAGFAFLPFCFGMVAAAALSSKLVSKVDTRVIAGTGTLIAAFSLFMFSRIEVDDRASTIARLAMEGGHVGDGVNYWTAIFPWVITMALGMGCTFIPLTLSAVHHIRPEESGIGSGVLNTMQQVGGALGLATLSTVATHVAGNWSLGSGGASASPETSPEVMRRIGELAGQAAFTDGATTAFTVAAGMAVLASLIIWTQLRVKHTELATDSPAPVAH